MPNSIRPTIIPRRLDGKDRLQFYLFFAMSVPDDTDFPQTKFFGPKDTAGRRRALWPAKLLQLLKDGSLSVAIKFEGDTDELAVPIRAIAYPEEEKLRNRYGSEYVRGLEIDPQRQGYSAAAWEAIFLPRAEVIADLSGLSKEERAQVGAPVEGPLHRLLASANSLKETLPANPLRASDLRPTHRLDSPDMDGLSVFEAQASAAARKGGHPLLAQGSSALAAALPGAATDLDRAQRMIGTSRNREGGGDGLAIHTMKKIATPTWQDLFGRVAQFPGLLRRLKLAIYCETATEKSADLWTRLANLSDREEGEIRLVLPVDPGKGVETGSHTDKLPDGLFFGLGVDKVSTAFVCEKKSTTYFRMKPTKDIDKAIWLDTQLLPDDLFDVTQADTFTAAARIVSAPDSADAPAPAPLREGIAILNKPILLKASGEVERDQANVEKRASVAEDLSSRLAEMHASELKLRKIGELRAAAAGLRSQLNALQDAPTSGRAALQTQLANALQKLAAAPPPMPLTSRYLLRGVSPEVKRGKGDWTSLCLRKVTLRNKKDDTVLRWVEEASVAVSIAATPPPAAGTLTGISMTSDPSIDVAIIGVNNVLARGGTGTETFLVPPEAQLNSIFRPVTRLEEDFKIVGKDGNGNELVPGDIVHVTADQEGSGKLSASYVSVHPVFSADPPPAPVGPLTPVAVVSKARANEKFALWIHATATGYLDEQGQAADAGGKAVTFSADRWKNGFIVEGERRAMAASADLIMAVEPAAAGQAGASGLALSPSAPGLLLHGLHVDERVDAPERVRLPFQFRASNGSVTIGFKEWLDLKGAASLEAVRGRVVGTRLVFAGKVKAVGSMVEIENLDSTGVFQLEIGQGVKLDQNSVAHTIRGIAQVDSPATSSAPAKCVIIAATDITPRHPESGAPVTNQDDVNSSDEARMLFKSPHVEWQMSLVGLDGKSMQVIFPAGLFGDLKRNPEAARRFLAPQKVPFDKGEKGLGMIVEFIGVRDSSGFRARYTPQYLFGTLAWEKPDKATLTLADGTVLGGLDASGVAQQISSPRQGFYVVEFKTAGSRAVVSLPPNAPAAPEPFFVAGEVTSSEVATLAGGSQEVRVTLAVGSGKSLTLTTSRAARYQPADLGLPPARVEDLAPGDLVFVEGLLGLGGVIFPTGPAALQNVTVGVRGRTSPDSSGGDIAQAMRDGQVDVVCRHLVTPAGIPRDVWLPPNASDAALGWVVGASVGMFGRTLTAYAAPGKAPEKLEDRPPSPVQASVSNRFAYWKGWSLVVANPEEGDPQNADETEKTRKQIHYSLDSELPDGFKLPRLRYAASRMKSAGEPADYTFRLRRADLVGNHYFDEPLASMPEKGASRHLPRYLRPDEDPSAPLVGLARPDGSVVIQPESSNADLASPRLVFVSDPLSDPDGAAGRLADPRPLMLLPPACAVSTVIESGLLDGRDRLEELFDRHERYLDDGTFRCVGRELNYFPDPLVYPRSKWDEGRIKLAIADSQGAIFQYLDGGGTPTPVPAEPANLSGAEPWPRTRPYRLFLFSAGLFGSPRPALHARTDVGEFYLPPGWSGQAQILNTATDSLLARVELIHATWQPRSRPEWLTLGSGAMRRPSESAEAFDAVVEINPRTTAAIRVAAYWNEYWDEGVPLHFVEAKVRARVNKGALLPNGIVIDNPGSGYGTRGRIVFASASAALSRIPGFRPPLLDPIFADGKLASLLVRDAGAQLPFDFSVRVLRRPPLHRFAEATVTRYTSDRGLAEIAVKDGGGYYDQPPIVVFHDLKGDGFGAFGVARMDEEGRISAITTVPDKALPKDPRNPGRGYSDDVVVGVYTCSKDLGEFPVPLQGPPSLEECRFEQNKAVYREPFSFSFGQDFGDFRSRTVTYAAAAACRFRDVLSGVQPGVRDRVGSPTRVVVRATAAPPQPECHHLTYSYRWNPRRESSPLVLESGMAGLTVRREGAIRCYLRRGWNATGEELLAVVVLHALQNRIKFPDKDGAPGLILTREERLLVSRWGYDPVWDDIATPPLTLDDLTNQVDFIPYEQLPGLKQPVPRMAGLALHRVSYDDTKNLWYADIGVRTPRKNLPFLQLALARYQANALAGLSMSQVVLPDPVRIPGHRELRISRDPKNPRRINVKLSGAFGRKQDRKLPRRSTVVELRKWNDDTAPEIEGAPLEIQSAQKPASLIDDATSVELARTGWRTFQGTFDLFPANRDEIPYLRVIEKEIYASDEPQRDRTGDTGILRSAVNRKEADQSSSADWRPFTCAVVIR